MVGLDAGTNPLASPALSESPFAPECITLLSVLKNRRMQFILTNYTIFALIDMCYAVLIPLMWSTPVGIGGLGLSPFQIGLTMGIWGFLNAFMQIKVTGRVIRKFGGAFVFKFAFVFYLLCFSTFPLSTFLAEEHGRVYVGSWLVISAQLFFQVFAYMSYGSYLLYCPKQTNSLLVFLVPLKPRFKLSLPKRLLNIWSDRSMASHRWQVVWCAQWLLLFLRPFSRCPYGKRSSMVIWYTWSSISFA